MMIVLKHQSDCICYKTKKNNWVTRTSKRQVQPNEPQHSWRQSFCITLVKLALQIKFIPRTKPELVRKVPQDPLKKKIVITLKILQEKKKLTRCLSRHCRRRTYQYHVCRVEHWPLPVLRDHGDDWWEDQKHGGQLGQWWIGKGRGDRWWTGQPPFRYNTWNI